MAESSFRMEYPSTGLRRSTRETQFFDQPDDDSSPSYSPRPLSIRSNHTTFSPLNSPMPYLNDTSDAETDASGYSTDQGVFAGPVISQKEKALMGKLSKGGLQPAAKEEEMAFVTQTPRKRLVKKDSREFHRRKTLVFSRGSVAGTPGLRDDGFFVRERDQIPSPSTSFNLPSHRESAQPFPPPSPLSFRPTTTPSTFSSLRNIATSSRTGSAEAMGRLEEKGIHPSRDVEAVVEGNPAEEEKGEVVPPPQAHSSEPHQLDRSLLEQETPSAPPAVPIEANAEYGAEKHAVVEEEDAVVAEGEDTVEEAADPTDVAGTRTSTEEPVKLDPLVNSPPVEAEVAHTMAEQEEVVAVVLPEVAAEVEHLIEEVGEEGPVEAEQGNETVEAEATVNPLAAAALLPVIDAEIYQAVPVQVTEGGEDVAEKEVEEPEVRSDVVASGVEEHDLAAAEVKTVLEADIGQEMQQQSQVNANPVDADNGEVSRQMMATSSARIASVVSTRGMEVSEAGIAEALVGPISPVAIPAGTRSPLSDAGNSTFNADSPLPTARAPSASMMLALSTNRPERHFERNIHDDGGPMMLSPVMSLDGMNQAIMQDIISPLKLASPSVRATPSRQGLKEQFALSPVSVQKENMVKPRTPSQKLSMKLASPLATHTYQPAAQPPSIKMPDRRLMKSQKAEKSRAQQVSAQLDLIASRMMPFPPTSQYQADQSSMVFEAPTQATQQEPPSSSRTTSKSSRRRSLRLLQRSPDKAADIPPVPALTPAAEALVPSISAPDFAPSLPTQVRRLPALLSTPSRVTTSRPPASEQVSRIRPVGRSLLKQPSISHLPSVKSSFPLHISAIDKPAQLPITEPSIFTEENSFQRAQPAPTRIHIAPSVPVRSPTKKLDSSLLGAGPVRPFMGSQMGGKRIAPVHPLPTPSKPSIASFGSPMRKPMAKPAKIGESSIMQSPARPVQTSIFATPRKPSSLWQSSTTATTVPSPIKSAPPPVSPIKQAPIRLLATGSSALPSRIPSLSTKPYIAHASASVLTTSGSGTTSAVTQSSPLKLPPSRKPFTSTVTQAATSDGPPAKEQPEPAPSQSTSHAPSAAAPPASPVVQRSRSGRTVRPPPAVAVANAITAAGNRAMKGVQSKTPKPKSDSVASRKREEESMALAELNRARNEVIFSALNKIKVRKAGKRPEGEPPTIAEKEKAAKEKAKAGKGKKREQDADSTVSEREEETPSDRHRRAPGDLEEYMTPARPTKRRRESDDSVSDVSSNGGRAHKRARGDSNGGEPTASEERRVRWDKGLILIGDELRQSSGSAIVSEKRSCLKVTRPLDDNGNLIGVSDRIPDIKSSSVDVWVIRYDGEEFEDGSPGPIKAKKAPAKKKASGVAGTAPAQPLAKKKGKN